MKLKYHLRVLALGMVTTACGGVVALGGPEGPTARVEDALGTMPTGTQTQASKVDLLLVVDNSPSMKDKQELLRKSLPDLLTRLVRPRCVDALGTVVGSATNGACASGLLEFAPVEDLHVGVISSSLGGRGGDLCANDPPMNDDAHLLQRGADGALVADAAAGFLAFGPGAITEPERLRADVASLVSGVRDDGCGFEAPLESWYRFLVQPDPYASIGVDPSGQAHQIGVDETILRQRRDFLRPDSLLTVVMLTDEDDASLDPLSVNAQGWVFANSQFPGSRTGRSWVGPEIMTTAARGSSACASSPASDACTSCAFAASCNAEDPMCQALRRDPSCLANDGYYGFEDDALNVRFHRMKQRFGLEPRYPVARYASGLSSATVPDRGGEHRPTVPADAPPPMMPYPPSYIGTRNCSNPIFSTNLPASATDELCNLAPGPRSRDLVVFTTITGVPPSLVTKKHLEEADWVPILGRDPGSFDETGIDPHMVQSAKPRPGLPGESAANDADPVHGRERNTAGQDLQFACTFPLDTPLHCAGPVGCECYEHGPELGGPLCGTGEEANVQLRGKAYPGIRPLEVARLLGGRATVSSLCPVHVTEAMPGDTQYAYRAAMFTLGDRMSRALVPAIQTR